MGKIQQWFIFIVHFYFFIYKVPICVIFPLIYWCVYLSVSEVIIFWDINNNMVFYVLFVSSLDRVKKKIMWVNHPRLMVDKHWRCLY